MVQPFAAVLAAFLLWGTQSPALAGERLALVVGNSQYRAARLPDLPNAGNDADAMAARLRKLGFAVTQANNVGADGLRKLIRTTHEQRDAEAVAFFYAGHAIKAGGETFLLAVDAAEPESVEAAMRGAVPLGEVLESIADPRRPTLVFVDACRTQVDAAAGGAAGLPRSNLFLGFAAQPGQDAVDGKHGHSPFTRALLQALVPGADVEVAFALVRDETARLTLGRQLPASVSSLQEPFRLKAAEGAVPPGG